MGLWYNDYCFMGKALLVFFFITIFFFWLYRSNRKPNCEHSNSSSPVIKGNINKDNEKIFHIPGQMYYDVTKIEEWKGEKMFCTEAEAMLKGFRRAKL